MEEIVENLAKEDPVRKEAALNGMLQQMLNMLSLTYKNTEDMPEGLRAIVDALEKNESKTETE